MVVLTTSLKYIRRHGILDNMSYNRHQTATFDDETFTRSARIILPAFAQNDHLGHECQCGFDDLQAGFGKKFAQILPHIVGVIWLVEADGKKFEQPVEVRAIALLDRFDEDQDTIRLKHPRHL